MSTSLNGRYPAVQGEFEDEFEMEYEDELESEYELEDEHEDEAFLGGLAKLAGSFLGEVEGEWEGEYEDEFEFEFEAEAESEDEDEDESEAFAHPIRRVYRDAELMAHLSTRAAQTESESEAEAFIGALIPMAARLIPRAASLIAKNAPALIKGATRVTRQLRRNPATRQLVQAMPVILQRTAQSLADQAANGDDIDPATALDTLSTMTTRVLAGPRRRRAVGAVQVFNQRYQRRARRTTSAGYGVPTQGRPGRRTRRAAPAPRARGNRRVNRR
jgi:hypothetical protein